VQIREIEFDVIGPEHRAATEHRFIAVAVEIEHLQERVAALEGASADPKAWRCPGCTCLIEAAGTRYEVRILSRACTVHGGEAQ